MIRTILLSASMIALAACSTTGEQGSTRQAKVSTSKPAPAPPPPIPVPAPVAEYRNWDGTVTYGAPSAAIVPAPPPASVTCWDGSIVSSGSGCPVQSITSAGAGHTASTPPKSGPTRQRLSNGMVVETIPPQYDTVMETVLVQPERIEYVSVPPVYETVTETVVVQESTTELVVIPPTYYADGTVATPQRTVERAVPAITKQETRRVIKTPAATAERVIREGEPIAQQVERRVETKPQRYILRDEQGQIIREFANAEEYANYQPNPYKLVASDPVSTFSADVDTASYAMVRPYVKKGQQPPKGSIRVEEMINYFDYDYALPQDKSVPFKPNVAVMPSPWNAQTKLVHIGVKGYEAPQSVRPDMNLVFLVDVSGSMQAENKLPLLKKSLNILVDQLERGDRISIVTYASGERVLLDGVRGDKKDKIREVINNLSAGGSTAGQRGMERAYEVARSNFKRKGVNRVIMATDGDFNVGISDPEALKGFVAKKRDTDVYLSMLGFGQGNIKDNRMQALAQNGNGTAGYIDSLREARKFFETDLASNTLPIADDVKIQVEFNPELVAEYRLIGYETRALARQDFNNDKVDAGDIGAGHTVTAIYEITPKGSAKTFIDPLRYSSSEASASDFAGEYAFVKLRYKLPGETKSRLLTQAVTRNDESDNFASAPASARWASAVAAYGLKLRGDGYMQDISWRDISRMAERAKGQDRYGYKAEFVELTRDARSIDVKES